MTVTTATSANLDGLNTKLNNQVGHTSLHVSSLGMGCGTLGDPDEITTELQAQQTLETSWAAGIRYFDTAPWYGNTLSERQEFVVSTKVGRVYFNPADLKAHESSPWMTRWRGGLPFDLRFDYSASGVQRSYEDSLTRMGLNRVDALVIHDLDPRHRLNESGVLEGLNQLDEGGGYAFLADLKMRGEIKAIGAGINHVGMIPRFLERFEIDYFLIAMPYTLLDQIALEHEMGLLSERGLSAVIGAVFASGILATGNTENAQYAYKPPDSSVRERVAKIQMICDRHAVPIHAAALQFPLAHSVVASVIPGANHPAQITANLEAMKQHIEPDFWVEMKREGIIRADAPCPGDASG